MNGRRLCANTAGGQCPREPVRMKGTREQYALCPPE